MNENVSAYIIDKLIKKYNKIIIFGHVNPDGDCVSSVRAVKHIILENYQNKEVYVTGTVPFNLKELCEKSDNLNDEDFKDALAIFVDLNEEKRVEDKRYKFCKEYAIIDHHIISEANKDKEAYYKIVDAPSATFVIYNFLKDLNLKCSKEIAYYLYIGLITDTKRFLNSSTPETFEVAKELTSYGIDTKNIYKELDKTTEALIKFKLFVYQNFKFSKSVCYLVAKKEDYLKLGLKQNDVSEQILLLANINNYHYWAFFLENEDGTVRCEYRSDGTKNVQAIALKFNGGGHYSESGGTLASLNDVKKVIEYIDNLED